MMSTLVPKQGEEEEKKKKNERAVNRGGGRRTAAEEREKKRKKTRMGNDDGRGGMVRFFPVIYVKLTGCNFYLKNSKAKPRLKWERQLQERFLQSIHALGGEQYATPKKILYMMNAVGLTLSHIKSHLQKYRLSVRAPPRRSRINRKEKTNSDGNEGGSSSSTKKFEANKQNDESSKLRIENVFKPLVIQEMKMAMEVSNKTVVPASATEKGKMASAGFRLETKSHPLRPNNNIGDVFQIGQSSFYKNLAYSNSNHQWQYSVPPPVLNSYLGKVGGNYQMNTSVQISSSLFQNTKVYGTEIGSSFSSLSVNSNSINNAISTFSPVAGIANSIGINPRFSGFPSMIENSMVSVNSSEFGLNFPSISVMEQSWMGGFGWGIPSINANANPARLGSISNSFFPMVAMRPAGSSFSFPSVIANSTELDSKFPMMISNPYPKGPGTNFSNSRVVMVTPTEPNPENPMMKLLDSNPILEPAPTEFGSIFSSRIANANPIEIGPGSSSSLTLNENPIQQPSGSSFSSVMADNPMDLGIRFNSNFDDSVDSGAGTSLSLSYDNNSINTDFSSSSVLENSMDLENST